MFVEPLLTHEGLSVRTVTQTLCWEGGAVMQEYAIGWGTLALINAGLAQCKRKSGLFWFLISLLLGPVATFLLVVLYPAEG